jgi:hypothetical protein
MKKKSIWKFIIFAFMGGFIAWIIKDIVKRWK